MKNSKILFGSVSKEDSCGNDDMDFMKRPSFIESVNNRIYFYSDVDSISCLQLNKSLRESQNSLIHDKLTRSSPNEDPLFLHVNSHGGSLSDGWSVADEILSLSVPVYTIVDGMSASAATLISIVGKKRFIKRHSYMLIHQFSAIHWGTYEQLKDQAINDEKIMQDIRNFYKEFTKIPVDVLTEILKHDFYFNAKECIDYGLADEIF